MSDFCKFYKEEKEVSYDGGTTWIHTGEYRKGDLIEFLSTDCGYIPPQYRWVNMDINTNYMCEQCGESQKIQYRTIYGTPFCNGLDLYVNLKIQVSDDYGSTWTTLREQLKLISENTDDCGTLPKFRATYSGYSDYVVECNSSSALTTGDTNYGGYDQVSSMVNAYIGDCVTSIDDNAFKYTVLTGITIGKNVGSIGNSAFLGVDSLSAITIPNRGLYNVGNNAFNGCSNLKSIIIGNVTMNYAPTPIWGNYCFANCGNLESLTIYMPSVPILGTGAFNGSDNCIVYVPQEHLSEYRGAGEWANIANRIKPIPNY